MNRASTRPCAVSILDLVHADDPEGIEKVHGALLADEHESFAVDVRLRVADHLGVGGR